ncbi:hypothetical protein [uncultured Roseovarius sp.]|uniref:hypothetical protein n=1 Tax=uncultured Roseovarius sp. TaxID=293344 RepID=UPI00260C69EF|nr:hypothetical protein [uncultured Roseovarius sp.]
MTADEFDAYTQNKTFYYGNQGKPYGAEEYLSDRRVIWTFLDGRCENGTWYQEGKQICFLYESQSEPQCWSFRHSSNGLVAQFENNPDETELHEVETSHEPLICLGPEVGV